MDSIWQDLRFALRGLRHDRGFTLAAIVTLGLCLAANIAMFAVVNGVLLEPLPFPDSGRLVTIHNSYPGAGVEVSDNGVPDYYDRLEAVSALDGLAMYRTAGFTIGGGSEAEAERVPGLSVTPSFFRVLGVTAARGRLFLEEEAEVGRDQKVVVTDGYWQRALGGRDDVIGSMLRINGTPFEVVGVLPADFRFVDPELSVIRSVAFTPEDRGDDQRHNNSWRQVGRLSQGATLEQVRAQLDALNAANEQRFPQMGQLLRDAGFETRAVGFQDFIVGGTRRTLVLLFAGVLFVLVIGCVNVANLVLVRSTARRRELATRHSLGASFGRLMRQSATEMMLVAAAGGALGLWLGWWAVASAPLVGIDQLPRGSEVAIDLRVIAFTLILVGAVGLVMAMLPVAALRRTSVAQVMREEGRSGTASRSSRTARRLLVASQVAFALILLVGAGVMAASLQRILSVDPGFQGDRVLTGFISPPAARYPDAPELRGLEDRLLESVRQVPGVEAVGFSSAIPFSGTSSDSVVLAEGYQMAPGESLISPFRISVSAGYFEAMGARLIAGRWFTDADADGRQRVIIVDERLARRFWPDGDAVGHRMYQPASAEDILQQPPEENMLTIVGVVGDMRIRAMVDARGAERPGAYYFPYRQSPSRTMGLAVRTSLAPEAMGGPLRRAIAAVDPELPLHNIRTMDERTEEALVDRRTPTLLAAGFAIVALILSAVGIYGVLAYQVSQRRREIGIRMALGAGAPRIFGLILGEGALIVGVGAAVGLAGAYLVRQALETQLYGVGAMEPWVVAVVAGVLMAVALAACFVPARRAAKTDPVIALSDS